MIIGLIAGLIAGFWVCVVCMILLWTLRLFLWMLGPTPVKWHEDPGQYDPDKYYPPD